MRLPKSIRDNRPDIFDEKVQSLAVTERIGNRNEAADRMALYDTPADSMPDFLKPVTRAAEKAREEAKAKENEIAQKVAQWNSYQQKLDEMKKLNEHICGAEISIENCKKDVAGFPNSLDHWYNYPFFGQFCDRVSSLMIAERILVEMPKWLEQARQEADQMQREVDRLGKQFKD